ncbi:MAG: hypothetical protein WCT08_06060 [Patescibacteria group bacterium]|jgi:H/ACA ribonucleoprotein complex subunit 3
MSIGKGGEADIFVSNNKAIKIFKSATHPDFTGMPIEQRLAEEKILEHQKKLPAFPKNLPARVIAPEDLVYDRNGNKIIGYSMKLLSQAEVLLRYAERQFRQAGISNENIIKIFQDLHLTVSKLHSDRIIIGDFNDLNVMVKSTEAYLIDADSFQFGQFWCKLFTARFTDPLLCNPRATSLELTNPHNANSDWYAYAVMLMQCLLFVGPYGGIYKPAKAQNRLPHDARPLKRITIFHPEVVYPKPAIPYGVLPDDLLQFFHKVFEKDQRGEFPNALFTNMRWTTCTACGKEHARAICPFCSQVAPAAIKETTVVRGKVIATRVFKTRGLIVYAAYQENKLRWLVHENGEFKREDGTLVAKENLSPLMRFRIQGNSTLIGANGKVFTFIPGKSSTRLDVDSFGTLPMFEANSEKRFWLNNGNLMADGKLGVDYPQSLGEVLANQTLFWAGPKFGFGFYRAGNLCVAFTFDNNRRGINDRVKIPTLRGQLIDATCVFTNDRCWFLVSLQEAGKIINQCFLIRPNGQVEAWASAVQGDETWLGIIRGKCAANNLLFAATDEGIVRVEQSGNSLVETQKFPDTESFVNAGNYLFPGKEGIYVVGAHDISLLRIQ